MTDLCRDCEWMKRDEAFRMRCHSPQLVKLGYAGMIVNFERADDPDAGRSHEQGTGACGPQALNFKRREAV